MFNRNSHRIVPLLARHAVPISWLVCGFICLLGLTAQISPALPRAIGQEVATADEKDREDQMRQILRRLVAESRAADNAWRDSD